MILSVKLGTLLMQSPHRGGLNVTSLTNLDTMSPIITFNHSHVPLLHALSAAIVMILTLNVSPNCLISTLLNSHPLAIRQNSIRCAKFWYPTKKQSFKNSFWFLIIYDSCTTISCSKINYNKKIQIIFPKFQIHHYYIIKLRRKRHTHNWTKKSTKPLTDIKK